MERKGARERSELTGRAETEMALAETSAVRGYFKAGVSKIWLDPAHGAVLQLDTRVLMRSSGPGQDAVLRRHLKSGVGALLGPWKPIPVQGGWEGQCYDPRAQGPSVYI